MQIDELSRLSISERFFMSVIETKALDDGYALRLTLEETAMQLALDWVKNKRLCCRFLSFALVIDKEFWLELRGTAIAKDYVRKNIIDKLPHSEHGLE